MTPVDVQADEAASKSGDSLEDLFSRISGDLDSTESEEDLKGILETMMSQLMSKDVLYEPLKELHDKVFVSLSYKVTGNAYLSFAPYSSLDI